MNYAFQGPANWYALPEAERATRAQHDGELCVIDGKEFYVRGCIEIPVTDSQEIFVFSVWLSISEESFRYIVDKLDAPTTDEDSPRFGWLCNWIRGYPNPKEIRCRLYLRASNLRPHIVLEPTDYPLAVEQRQGITLERIKQIAAEAGH
jgi:hypothetical protein